MRLLRRFRAVAAEEGAAGTLRWLYTRLRGRPWTEPLMPDRQYRIFLARDRLQPARRRALRREARTLPYQPVVSVLMPVHNVALPWVAAALSSIRRQIYPRWELCVVDDASTAPHIRPLLQKLARRERRVRLRRLERNAGISGALSHALDLARGEFVALLDHDDVLHPEALLEVVRRLNGDRSLDVVYTDHDFRDADGRRHAPFFKPDWSPDLLLSMNYVTHFVVARRELVQCAGGYRPGYDGAEDHDLLLRLSERTPRIAHIPRPLYSWGQAPASTASAPAVKPYAHEAGRRAVQDALARRGIEGDVIDGGPGLYRYRVRRRILGRPLVSVVVVPEAGPAALQRCLSNLEACTRYAPREVVVTEPVGAGVTRAQRWNEGVRAAQGEHVVLLRDGGEAVHPEWIEALLEHAQRPEVGAVGAKRISLDGRIRHAGLVLGLQSVAGRVFAGFPENHPTYWGLAHVIRNVAAVDSGCLMTRRDLFLEYGGFDAQLSSLEDVDYCLRVRQAGRTVVYTPYAVLREHASPLAIGDRAAAAARLRERWGTALERDPYYNPHLTLERTDCSLRVRRDFVDGSCKPRRFRFRRRFHGQGIEIGALHDPMPVDLKKARVQYVDRLTPAEQIDHYPELADRMLVIPDIIAPADRLERVGAGSLDFVIASQLLPQLEDPIAALLEWHRVLVPGGLLFLAVPDHRRTFDRGRPTVTLAHLVDDHRDGGAVSRLAHYEEYSRAARGTDGDRARADARDLMARGYAATFHAFTPETVRALLRHMGDAMGRPWEIADAREPDGGDDELLILLRKAS